MSVFNLINKKCIKIIGREFWLNGNKVSDIICIFLELEDNVWYKIYNDDEDLKWKIEVSEEYPKVTDILGDNEFSYPHKDLAELFGLDNLRIISFKEISDEKGALAKLKFENQKTITLFYDYIKEIESISCR